MAKLQQVLLVKPAAQLLGKVLGVLCTRVECEQPVQVRENSGPQIASTVCLRQPVKASQRLSSKDHVRSVLRELAEDLFVVRAWDRVEFVDSHRDAPPLVWRQRRL